jgi:hypothetical protein
VTGRRDPKGPNTVYLPDGWNKPVVRPVPKPCCARCKTPYGHSAQAGMCCHTTKESK